MVLLIFYVGIDLLLKKHPNINFRHVYTSSSFRTTINLITNGKPSGRSGFVEFIGRRAPSQNESKQVSKLPRISSVNSELCDQTSHGDFILRM